MGTSFWLGLLLAVPLGIASGIASNLLTPRLLSYLENRKLRKTNKTRQQALQGYNRIKAFREGKRDKYPYYMLLVSAAVICATVASTMVIIVFVISPEFPNAVLWLMIAFIFAMLSVAFLIGIYETARHLERFDDYKMEIEQKWGPIR
jgi:sensor histidine kinase YesM